MRKKICLALGLAASAFLLSFGTRAAEIEVTGKVKVELYTTGGFSGNNGNLGGTAIANLTSAASYPDSPTAVIYAPIAEYPFNDADDAVTDGYRAWPGGDVFNNYGVRMSGFLHPPTSGTWYFYIATDDGGQLFISTDENPANAVLVAQETAWSDRRYYFNVERPFAGLAEDQVGKGGNKRDDGQTGSITADGRYKTSNVSDPIVMTAGKKYYFYALMKEGGGTDDLSIWATQDKNPIATLGEKYPDYPDGSKVSGTPHPLDGPWISTLGSDTTVITQQPVDSVNLVGTGYRFEVKVAPGINAGKLSYKWFQNNVEVLDPNGESINSPFYDSIGLNFDPVRLAELADNNTNWKVEITPETGPKLTSTVVKLLVSADSVGPKMLSARGSDLFQTVTVIFDSPLAEAGVVPGNFTITGATVDAATLLNPDPVQPSRVLLHTTAKYAEDANLTVTAKVGVKDLAGNSTSPTTIVFHSYTLLPGVANYLQFRNETSGGNQDGLLTFRDSERVTTDAADYTEVVTRFGYPQTANPNVDNFFGLVRGFVTPPETGDYVFFFASDDPGTFWLSTDATPANLKAIAIEPTWAGFADFLGSDNDGTRARIIADGAADATPANIGKLRNRSDVFPGSEWAGGPGPIRLVKGQRYYAVGLHKEGGGGDDIAVGVKLASAADSTVAILSGNWIQGYGDPTEIAPTFSIQPRNKNAPTKLITTYNKGDTLEFETEATQVAGEPITYQWYRGSVLIPGATGKTLTIENADHNDSGGYWVNAITAKKTTASQSGHRLRAMMNGAFVIEGEDFNSNGADAAARAAANAPGYLGGAYQGLGAVNLVDYTRTDAEAAENATYRVGEAPNVPMNSNLSGTWAGVLSDESIRGSYSVTASFKIGWAGGGHYYNYTRAFPPGQYVAYGAFSYDENGGANRLSGNLSKVTGVTTTTQTATPLGTFTGRGTHGWGANDLIPLLTNTGEPAVFDLASGDSVRAVAASGDFDYLLFYNTSVQTSLNASITHAPNNRVSIEWSGNAKLSSSPTLDGTYTALPGATSPFTPAADAASRFYKLSPQ